MRARLDRYGVEIVQSTPPFYNRKLLSKALELFGAGTKIAIQIAVMATDAGTIEEGEEVISMAGTYKGLDASLLVRTAICWNLLTKFEVLETLAKPRNPRVSLPEYKDPRWKGNLNQYYE